MDQKDLSNLIIKHVGGTDNIKDLYHCMTRLRFKLNDKTKFDVEALKKVPGVINTVQTGDEFQLIIGAEVDKYYNDLLKHGADKNTERKSTGGKFDLKNAPKAALNMLVGIMAPIIPIIIAGGMVKVILSLCVLSGMGNDTQNYKILSFISDAPFYFLPFFIANSAAKKFETNQFMAMVIAGVMLHPNFLDLVASGKGITFFDLPVKAVKYGSSVIPIILVVWFMSYLEKFVEKIVPQVLKTMLRPMLLLIITAPLALIVIGPLGAYLGNGVYFVLKAINDNAPWLVPTVMGGFAPLLVMTGMHLSLVPFEILSLSQFGYEIIMGPGMLASNITQGGAALAIALKAKKEKRQVAISAGITALSGITEPALYGVTLKYKRTLACVMVSGAIAGLYAGITGVVRYAIASAGFLSLPVFMGDNPSNIINAVITAVIALVLSFTLTYIFVKVEKGSESVVDKETDKANETFSSVACGKVIPLAEVKDEAFSSGALGYGAAIIPTKGAIYSPVEGKIGSIYPTGHAVGIISNSGREILIHIGIDTVKLEGEGFKSHIKNGMEVKKGDLLIDVDLDLLKEKGYDTTVIIVILNSVTDNMTITKKDRLTINDTLLEMID